MNMKITQKHLHIIQDSLVTVWQHHIQQWNETQDDAHIETQDVVPSSSSTVNTVPTRNPVEKKGHTIKPISDSPGFFCEIWAQHQISQAH